MAQLKPFKGIRYNLGTIKDLSLVTTPPYDIISSAEQDEFYKKHENNIIRIELGEDFEGDNDTNNKYTRAGEFLNKWLKEGILAKEESEAFYVYEQEFKVGDWDSKIRRGLISLVKLAEFSEGIVLPHEYTLSKAKQDRFNLMCTTDANISHIFCLYNDNNSIFNILNIYTSNKEPDIEYVNSENINERIWIITDKTIIDNLINLFEDKKLFIADGHHRYETALKYRNKKASENPLNNGSELYNYVMMTLVDMDDPGLIIFPTHRAVSIDNFDSQDFLKFSQEYFEVQKIDFNKTFDTSYRPKQISISLEQSGEFGTSFGYFDGQDNYYILTLKDKSIMKRFLPDKPDVYRELDVAILHSVILEQYFKIDAENMANQKNLTYIKNISDAIEGVNARKFNCAFFLNPTRVSQMKEVSLANEKMPQKSTYFYPKLTTGLVINKF